MLLLPRSHIYELTLTAPLPSLGTTRRDVQHAASDAKSEPAQIYRSNQRAAPPYFLAPISELRHTVHICAGPSESIIISTRSEANPKTAPHAP